MMKSDESDEETILVLYHIKDLPVHPQLLIFKTSSGADLIPFGSIIGRIEVALDVIWSDALRWNHMIPRLGCMHWFIGCVGVLMENSGLVPWLQSAFASVLKMMSGKKFPMNIRALRFAVMELLKGFIDDVYSYEDLEKRTEFLAQKSDC